MSFNLPPGCNESDIPGNRPEDEAFDTFMDTEEFARLEKANASESEIDRAFWAWYEPELDWSENDP